MRTNINELLRITRKYESDLNTARTTLNDREMYLAIREARVELILELTRVNLAEHIDFLDMESVR